MLVPPHTTAYFYGTPEMVLTVARNYFDLRGTVGNTPYVGTIFMKIYQETPGSYRKRVRESKGDA